MIYPVRRLMLNQCSMILIRQIQQYALLSVIKKQSECFLHYSSASFVTRSTSSSVVLPSSTLRKPSSRIEPASRRA